MLASGLPSALRIVSVPAVAVYFSVRPSTLTECFEATVRSSTGAPVHASAAAFARSSLCSSSTLLPLSLSGPAPDCAKAGETARAAAAQQSVRRRIGTDSLGWWAETEPAPCQKLVSRRNPLHRR